MIKAIVYTSNAGHTKRYAEILSNKLSLPMYNFEEANKILKDEEIIYMGWLLAGGIKDFEKVRKIYNIKAVCAVGMGSPEGNQSKDIIKRHHINNEKYFYLQGGFDMKRLHGLYKFMMKFVSNIMMKEIEKKEVKTEEDMKMIDSVVNGSDYVREESLEEIINWIKEN
jgi:hypothetical protein